MKKIFVLIVVALIMTFVISSCEAGKACPAYSTNNTGQNINS